MICMIHHSPVSPLSEPPDSPGGGGAARDHGNVDEETVDFKHVLPDQERIMQDTPQPIPVRSPTAMTAAQKAIHDLTHMPPDQGCSICRSTRAPNLGHSATREHERTSPLLVGDDCFLKSFTETVLATCLVLRLYPYRIFLACIVPKNCYHPDVISHVARFIQQM